MKKLFLVFCLSSLVLASIVCLPALRAEAACTQAIPTSFKSEVLSGGTHTAGSAYKIAIYDTTATLSASTATYTTSGEVSGAGYTAGGMALTGFSVTTSGTTAILDWTTDPQWTSATITAATCFLIYNSTSGAKAVYVGTFSSTSSTNGTFTIVFPTPAAGTGLIRFN